MRLWRIPHPHTLFPANPERSLGRIIKLRACSIPIERDCQSCHHPAGVKNVMVDIRPGSDPNPIKAASQGVLPASILDWKDYAVTEIAVSSLLLEGEVGEPTGGRCSVLFTPYKKWGTSAKIVLGTNTQRGGE